MAPNAPILGQIVQLVISVSFVACYRLHFFLVGNTTLFLHVPRAILKSTSQFRFVIVWPFRTLPRPKTNNLRNDIWPSYYVLLIACRDAGAVGAVAAVCSGADLK